MPGRNQRSRAEASERVACGERAKATARPPPSAAPTVLAMRSATLASRVGRYICNDSIASDKAAPAATASASCERGPRRRGISPTKNPNGT